MKFTLKDHVAHVSPMREATAMEAPQGPPPRVDVRGECHLVHLTPGPGGEHRSP